MNGQEQRGGIRPDNAAGGEVRDLVLARDTFRWEENPRPRCPVVLMLDVSSSMAGAPIAELQTGAQQFFDELYADEVARFSVEVALITFASEVELVMPFFSLAAVQPVRVPAMQAWGVTCLGGAVQLAQQLTEERKALYRRQGMAYYQPWLVLLTDGAPNDDWQPPVAAARQQAETHKQVNIGVGIGPQADMHMLAGFCATDYPAARLRGLRFRQFFRWLSQSMRTTTRNSTCNEPRFDAFNDWQV